MKKQQLSLAELRKQSRQLTRKEMSETTAGDVGVVGDIDKGDCTCTCKSGSSWYYPYGAQPSDTYLNKDIKEYCGDGGGSCTSDCTNYVASQD
jgi:hypothetical protein